MTAWFCQLTKDNGKTAPSRVTPRHLMSGLNFFVFLKATRKV
nr:MAG TPA: hypothetical protein [Caudoviricetes sp.]